MGLNNKLDLKASQNQTLMLNKNIKRKKLILRKAKRNLNNKKLTIIKN